jgi:hypothetical protein
LCRLPTKVRDMEDLKKFVSPEYFETIEPFVLFEPPGLVKYAKENDPVLYTYYVNNNMLKRVTLTAPFSNERASIDVTVNSTIDEIRSDINICVGSFKSIDICL